MFVIFFDLYINIGLLKIKVFDIENKLSTTDLLFKLSRYKYVFSSLSNKLENFLQKIFFNVWVRVFCDKVSCWCCICLISKQVINIQKIYIAKSIIIISPPLETNINELIDCIEKYNSIALKNRTTTD